LRRPPLLIPLAGLLASCAATSSDYETPGGYTGARLVRAVEAARAHPLGAQHNPVRADMPGGQQAYLHRLRCSDGTPVEIRGRGSLGRSPFGGVIDAYRVGCASAEPREAIIHMDMYHPGHLETSPPPGFTISD
jgi:hypothetical protein